MGTLNAPTDWHQQLQLVGGSARVSLTETIAVLITHN